jgi:hypothetical protein
MDRSDAKLLTFVDPRPSHILYTGCRASLYTGEKHLARGVETRCSSLCGTRARTSYDVSVGGTHWSAFTRGFCPRHFFLRAKEALYEVDRGEEEWLHRKLLERSLHCHPTEDRRDALKRREGRRVCLRATQTSTNRRICHIGGVCTGGRELLLLLGCCSALAD